MEPAAAVEVASDLDCWKTWKRSATVGTLPRPFEPAPRCRWAAVWAIRPGDGSTSFCRASAMTTPRGHHRLDLQARVLDEWGFQRPRQRAAAHLFSGPGQARRSGEVLAGALRVDLLFMDISRVVSGIGETEKNLAVFDAAEPCRCSSMKRMRSSAHRVPMRTTVTPIQTAYLLAVWSASGPGDSGDQPSPEYRPASCAG